MQVANEESTQRNSVYWSRVGEVVQKAIPQIAVI